MRVRVSKAHVKLERVKCVDPSAAGDTEINCCAE